MAEIIHSGPGWPLFDGFDINLAAHQAQGPAQLQIGDLLQQEQRVVHHPVEIAVVGVGKHLPVRLAVVPAHRPILQEPVPLVGDHLGHADHIPAPARVAQRIQRAVVGPQDVLHRAQAPLVGPDTARQALIVQLDGRIGNEVFDLVVGHRPSHRSPRPAIHHRPDPHGLGAAPALADRGQRLPSLGERGGVQRGAQRHQGSLQPRAVGLELLIGRDNGLVGQIAQHARPRRGAAPARRQQQRSRQHHHNNSSHDASKRVIGITTTQTIRRLTTPPRTPRGRPAARHRPDGTPLSRPRPHRRARGSPRPACGPARRAAGNAHR